MAEHESFGEMFGDEAEGALNQSIRAALKSSGFKVPDPEQVEEAPPEIDPNVRVGVTSKETLEAQAAARASDREAGARERAEYEDRVLDYIHSGRQDLAKKLSDQRAEEVRQKTIGY